MAMMKEEKPGYEIGTPAAGGKHTGKPMHEKDALGEEQKARYKNQTEFEAKEVPGAARSAVKKQTFDADGCDETMRTPCNTGCSHK